MHMLLKHPAEWMYSESIFVVDPPKRRGDSAGHFSRMSNQRAEMNAVIISTGRHPAPHLIKNDDSCKAHFGGLFLWAKKSPHGFMQARQLHLDFVPVYVFCPEVERYCLEYIL